jgi:Zn-dependent protease with chaperone function
MSVFNTGFLVFVCAALSPGLLVAQSTKTSPFYDYKPARCAGAVPADFKQKSSEKAEAAKEQIRNKRISRTDKKQEAEHAVTSSFAVDEMLSSGQVLFGEPMSVYVEQVAERLLKENDQKEITDKLRFYVLKSHVPNAYCTSNGAVLVSVGLLSRLENEAQLAFILSHEIQHYILKHSLKQYKKVNVIKASTRNRLEDKLKEVYSFSKENETEADDQGFKMMQRAGYNLDEGVYVFDMLKYAEYPFLEISLTIDSLETKHYKFPEAIRTFVNDAVKKGGEGDEKHLSEQGDENNTTHPSLDRRINRMRDMIAEDGNQKGKPVHFIGKEVFENVSKTARHELLLLYLRYADYGNAFYLAQVMEKLYGNSLFLGKVKAMCMYGLVHHQSLGHNLNKYGCDVSKSRGEWRPLSALFSKMDLKELCAFGSRQMYLVKQQYKTDPFIDKVARGFFKVVQGKGLLRLQDLTAAKATGASASDTASAEEPSETGSGIKNPRNRAKRSATSGAALSDYYMLVFADIENKDYLNQLMRDMHYSEPVKSSDEVEKPTGKPVQVIDHLVMFPPQIELAYGANKRRDLYQEEDYKDFLGNTWSKLGSKANVDVDVLQTNIGEGVTLEAINDYMALNDWILERLNNDTQAMILFNGDYIGNAMGRKNSKHVGWVSYEYQSAKRAFSAETMVACLVLYPALPFYLVWQFSTTYTFKEFCMVFNTETGTATHVKRKEFAHAMRGDLLNAQIYETLYNIKYGK